MPDRTTSGKKNSGPATLNLMGDDETPPAKTAPKARTATAPAAVASSGVALFDGDDVDLSARHPSAVPVGGFPAPSQIAPVPDAQDDPFAEDDPFAAPVMAQMLADEPAPLFSPLRAAREDLMTPPPVAEAAPDLEEMDFVFAAPAEAAPTAAVPEAESEAPSMELEAPPAEAAEVVETKDVPDVLLEKDIHLEEETPMAASVAPAPKPAKAPKTPAPKPNQGLTIARRYTQAGQDVFATTEYDLRTASIVGSDGTVVFEQSGVEIPKAWSQLATNVVVSKYFRGHVGTLEREYSVKQLIGRVADKILEWGRQGQYFATDEDASAFHDELRYILLHQYAAFNSPVWFNLGWPGRRQAVSACLPYDVRVNTDRGLLPIGEIVRLFQSMPDPQISTYAPDGTPSRVVAAVCNGRKRVINFHLADGSTLRCTSNHRVFVRTSKGEIAEKQAGDLVIGVDRLVLSRSVLLPQATSQSLNSMTPDADLAWLTGLMVGDGYCGRSETLTSDTWDLKINTDPEKARVEAILNRYGVPFRTHVKSWGFCLRGHGAVSRGFWSALGLWDRVGDKRVPEWVYRTSAENVGAFLGGLFDADGHVSENGNRRLPVFSNTSLPLMQATQTLLRSLGIYAALTAYTDTRDDCVRKTSYSLGIHDNISVEQFEQVIGFTHAHKQARMTERLIETAASIRGADVLVVSKTLGGPEFVYDIQTESETFWAEGVLLHNCYINEVDDTMESILDLYKTEGMLFKDGSGSGINLSILRSSKERLEAGGKSSGPISFMKGLDASAGSIKSGGSTRRAACMRVLDIDHPDVKEFIDCKKDAELKAHALIDAGYSGAFNVAGGAYDTVPFQNANHSVRVTDEFMQAVETDSAWDTKFRLSGKTAETFRARDLMRGIAEGTWVCGDPGMQYDTTINDWHTCANTDRIYASNPCCITSDTLVAVADGRNAVPIKDLVGTEVPVYAHDHSTGNTTVSRMWNIGIKRESAPVHRITLDDGSAFRATDDHLIMLRDGSYRMVRDLTPGDSLMPFHSSVLTPAKTRTKRRYYWTGRSWKPQYRAVWEYAHGTAPDGCHIHHSDFNALNDTLLNLVLMIAEDHNALHGDRMRGDNNPARRLMTDEWRRNIGNAQRGQKNANYGRTHSEETRHVMREKAAVRWADPQERERSGAAVRATYDRLKAEGVRVGRPLGERYERCCPVCRGNYVTRRVEQIFCSDACRCSPMGRQMSGEKTWAQNRGRTLSAEHRARLSTSVSAASDPEVKRRAAQTGHRNTALKAARLLMDNGVTPSLGAWDALRADARALGASRIPTAATVRQHFATDCDLQEEAALYNHKVVAVEFCGYEDVYDGTVDTHHNFAILTSSEDSCAEGSRNYSGIFIHNSEYMFLNSTACNLSSLNLMKFRNDDASFDTESFEHAVQIMLTAQEIVVGFAAYPTPKIEERSHVYRTLGLGYANLGALLMAAGLPYDSDAGRAYAGAITATMTGRAYHQSAVIARDCGGPFAGFAENRDSMLRVMGKHRQAVDTINPQFIPATLLDAARRAWDDAVTEGEASGYRNAQATVLAPTGCLVGDSLILTSRGLVRLQSLGNTEGKQWQPLDVEVATDEGPRQASQFYINGAEAVVTVETGRGYRIQGTPTHRIKVVDAQGEWQWRRFAEIKPGDRVPLMLGGLVGEPQHVPLPPLPEAYWTSDHTTIVPRRMTPDLAEFVGYFMGDGSLHSRGLRLCVAQADQDVVMRLSELGKSLFGLEAAVSERKGYTEVAFHSVRLTLWWEASGFAKRSPSAGHSGKGYEAHVPDAVLHANDARVYAGFVRGLFEADGTNANGYVAWTTATERFSRDVQSLLLTLGFVTTRKADAQSAGRWGRNTQYVLRLLNVSSAKQFGQQVGFLSARKMAALQSGDGHPQAARYDQIPLSRELVDLLAPANDNLRKTLLLSLSRSGTVSRRAATELLARAQHPKLGHLLGFFYDEVATAELGEEQMTYDLSVPDNVTYVANGFISHNTIGFLMDCDTTGIEPDIAIVKYKSLVGGGMMKIVNQTVPEALQRLGYTDAQVQSVIAFIDENDTIEGAPDLKPEHLPIFDCAFRPMNGTRSIHHMGHLKMMGAAQPFISGAISKTVNVPNDATPDDIADTYLQAWKLGVKAVAIYRDGSKRTQPLNTSSEVPKADKASATAEPATTTPAIPVAVRRRLPDERQSLTHKFSIGGHEGYLTVGLYPDTMKPGEIFIRMSKEGSSISGLMDSFATAVSLALQYGVPLQTLVDKFIHSRFEPSGFTGNREIPMAKSIMDYMFRYMALKFLAKDERRNAGLLADQEGYGDPAPSAAQRLGDSHDAKSGSLSSGTNGTGGYKNGVNTRPAGAVADLAPNATAQIAQHDEQEIYRAQSDAPPCPDCGSITIRSGACYKCQSCGTSLGCS